MQEIETSPTIKQMNEVIADFMGYYFNASKFYSKDGKRGTWFKEAKYHTSWDWLMPVGKKIYDLLDKMQTLRPPHTACRGDVLEVDIRCHIMEYNLPNAHESIYQFITWYNQQPHHQ